MTAETHARPRNPNPARAACAAPLTWGTRVAWKTLFAWGTLLVLTGAAQEPGGRAVTELDPRQPLRAEKLRPVTYQVDFSAVVTPPYHTHKLQVWLPIPTSDFAQEVQPGKLRSFPQQVEPRLGTEPVHGNRFAYFEFTDPQGAQLIQHQFTIKTWELRWKLDPARVQPVAEWPASFAPYLHGDGQSVVVDDRFRALLPGIVPQSRGPLQDLSRVMLWVEDNFQYDHRDASLRASAEHGLLKRHGHCSDYHSFCASLGRSLGYPTRVVYGINPFPKNSPSHCKLEAFLPPYGWVCFDVSETARLIQKIRGSKDLAPEKREELARLAQRRLERGFRDNTWFLQTRGTDYDVVPPASRKVPVVRTIYVEADGQPLPEPDPANPAQREFAWMTVHHYTSDVPAAYPFADASSLTPDE